MKQFKTIWAVYFFMFTFQGLAYSNELSIEKIVEKTNLTSYYAGQDGRAKVTMTITNKDGKESVKEFFILRKDIADGGDQNFYVYFKRPSDVRKMVYMVLKHTDKDDDRWLYLSKLDLVRRIAASDKRTSFVGSHFVYEDVSGRNPKEDTHELLEVTDQFYIIKNTPKQVDSVEFSYYTLYIDKNKFLPLKAEYFDKEGKKYRLVEALKVKDIQGNPTVIQAKVTNLETKGHTISKFSDVQYDIGLKDSIFSERYLRRPPRKWIK